MQIKQSHKHFMLGFIAALVISALVRLLFLMQDGGMKSSAMMAGPDTHFCVNQENPNEACVSVGAGGGMYERPGYGEVASWAFTGFPFIWGTDVTVIDETPDSGGR
jgi:hypothetical protein